MDAIDKIKQGHKRFKDDLFAGDKALFDQLATGQQPKFLVISCSDSRVDPTMLTGSKAGDLFVVRNVANLVPPYDSAHSATHRGTAAAIEYGVNALGVENIAVMGHKACGGIQALVKNDDDIKSAFPFVHDWVQVALPARAATLEALPDADLDSQCRHCEKESVRRSVDNLMSFPYVAEKVKDGSLNLHGWYFDIGEGCLEAMDPDSGEFAPLI